MAYLNGEATSSASCSAVVGRSASPRRGPAASGRRPSASGSKRTCGYSSAAARRRSADGAGRRATLGRPPGSQPGNSSARVAAAWAATAGWYRWPGRPSRPNGGLEGRPREPALPLFGQPRLAVAKYVAARNPARPDVPEQFARGTARANSGSRWSLQAGPPSPRPSRSVARRAERIETADEPSSKSPNGSITAARRPSEGRRAAVIDWKTGSRAVYVPQKVR